MLSVKVTTNYPEWPFERQTSGEKGIWGNCRFILNQEVEECDFWVVHSGLLRPERARCAPANTIFVSGEPPTVQRYHPGFLKQFAAVITCHRDIDHPNAIYSQQALPWHVGRLTRAGRTVSFSKNYDELKAIDRFSKDRGISVITSAKDFTEGHRKRLNFVSGLYRHYGPRIDIYGRGVREVGDKWAAISQHKYHIAIENSSFPDYWTEKLADSFLGGAFTFYYGCPNLADYFPPDSFSLIDIDDFEKSIKIIDDAIENQQYEKSVKAISEARELVLDKYNFFPMIEKICSAETGSSSKQTITLLPERSFHSMATR